MVLLRLVHVGLGQAWMDFTAVVRNSPFASTRFGSAKLLLMSVHMLAFTCGACSPRHLACMPHPRHARHLGPCNC